MKCPNCNKTIKSYTHRGRPYCDNCNSLFPSLEDKYKVKRNQRSYSLERPLIIILFTIYSIFTVWLIWKLQH